MSKLRDPRVCVLEGVRGRFASGWFMAATAAAKEPVPPDACRVVIGARVAVQGPAFLVVVAPRVAYAI